MADISSLVQESLSVSGILLGKTMGRSAELAGRFGTESARLADLEVRARMAGRWMMASIQTTFAVMPALVYCSPASSRARSRIGTLVAFTTLQTRLFFPIGSLLGVSVDVQSSLALFDRVFEYLDQPVDIEEGTRTLSAARRRRARRRLVPLRRGGLDAAGRLVRRPGRDDDGARRRDRLREDDAGYLVARLYDATDGPRHDRRRRRARPHLRVARGRGRGRLAGDVPLPRDRAREPPLREARTRATRRSRRPRGRRRSTS